jgi:membrane protease YdiL (CAAX protease family)
VFRFDFPLVRLVQLLIGAGLIEELLFRVGIMTLVWGWTRRWGWGLVVSALAFGLYHISPLSGISALNLERPIATVLSSFNMGLVTGVVYRYRGFETAVLVHGLGDWVIVMLLASV